MRLGSVYRFLFLVRLVLSLLLFFLFCRRQHKCYLCCIIIYKRKKTDFHFIFTFFINDSLFSLFSLLPFGNKLLDERQIFQFYSTLWCDKDIIDVIVTALRICPNENLIFTLYKLELIFIDDSIHFGWYFDFFVYFSEIVL